MSSRRGIFGGRPHGRLYDMTGLLGTRCFCWRFFAVIRPLRVVSLHSTELRLRVVSVTLIRRCWPAEAWSDDIYARIVSSSSDLRVLFDGAIDTEPPSSCNLVVLHVRCQWAQEDHCNRRLAAFSRSSGVCVPDRETVVVSSLHTSDLLPASVITAC